MALECPIPPWGRGTDDGDHVLGFYLHGGAAAARVAELVGAAG
jgi:hypothetical protein